MGLRPKSIALTGVVALVASTIGMGVVAPAAQANERLPWSSGGYPSCVSDVQTWCVESVSIERLGFPVQEATWVPAAEPVVSENGASPVNPTSAVRSYPGRWSLEAWPTETLSYDGVFIEAKPASEGSDFLWIRVMPANSRGDGTVGLAVRETPSAIDGNQVTRDLSPDMTITVKVRIGGALEPSGSVLVANGSIDQSVVASGKLLTFTATPTAVPQAPENRPRDESCFGEEGVSRAVVRQQQAFVVFSNTAQGYGYDGMTGDLSISSNGTCLLTTPSYDNATGSFSFFAAAPHYAEDGTTVNRGFYQAIIPLADAQILFGISSLREVRTALELVIETENGEDVAVQFSVRAAKGAITLTYRNFQYSAKALTLKVKDNLWKSKYKRLAKKAQAKAKG
jgi:hypothetical protein